MTGLKLTKATEDSVSYKELLLWIVRLIHADPYLMLHVSIAQIIEPPLEGGLRGSIGQHAIAVQ